MRQDPSELISRGTPAYGRLRIALLVAGFSTFALMYDVQPILPLFTAQFGINAATSSLAVSLTTGIMAVAFLPAAVVSDRLGRRPMMVFSLLAAAALTLLSAAVPAWSGFLAVRAAIGLALAGVPSVAMAYVSEEVHPTSIGSAMGLYIAASAIGGMAGRLGMALGSEFMGWRIAIAVMGLLGMMAGLAFAALAPRSRTFTATHHDLQSVARAVRTLLADRVLRLLYTEAFLLMGVFVTIYNYIGFRLEAPPYGLNQAAVGAIFLVYLLGSVSSAWAGALASRRGPSRVLWVPIALLAGGIAITQLMPLTVVLFGLALLTCGFFAAHSTASGWVGRRATRDRAQASALYLLFYYFGGSVLGTAGGIAWNRARWTGVMGFVLLLALAALWIARRLSRVDGGFAASAEPPHASPG